MKNFLTYFCLCLCASLFAQVDSVSEYPNSEYFFSDLSEHRTSLDTMRVQDVNLYPVSNRKFTNYFQNLGVIGLANKSLEAPEFYTPTQFYLPGFERYLVGLDSVKYYKLKKQYTHAYFTQAGSADDIIISVDYGRNFSEKYGLGIHYSRFKNAGFFDHQNSEHTSLGISNWYIPKSEKYKMYLKGVFNTARQQENWGLSDFSLLGADNISSLSIPIHNQSAEVLNRRFNGEFKHSLDVNFGKITHSVEYWNNWIKYDDESTAASLNLSDYSIYADTIDITRRVNESHLTNSFSFTEPILETEFGIRHKSYKYLLGNYKEKYQSLGLFAKQDLSIDSTIIHTRGEIEFVDGASDLYLSTSSVVGNKLPISLNADYKNTIPSIVYRRIVVGDSAQFYDNSLDNIGVLSLGASTDYSIKHVDFNFGASYKTYKNYVYLDTAKLVTQESAAHGLLSIDAGLDLSYRAFHLDNQFRLHSGDYEFFRIPSYIYTGTAYYNGHWFKKRLNTVIGLRTRYVPEHKGQEYFPLLSTFYHSEDTLGSLVNTDVFINFKVERFKLFFEVEDVLNTEGNYQEIDSRYVMEKSKFRFGIAWGWLE